MWPFKKKPLTRSEDLHQKHFNIENDCSVKTIIDEVIITTTKLDLPEELYWTSAFPYAPKLGTVAFDNELYFRESDTLDSALEEHTKAVRHFLGL